MKPQDSKDAQPRDREKRRDQNGPFPATRWSVILAAGGEGSTGEAAQAWEVLCGRYWLPVYLAIRGRGHGSHDAEDLTQEFFAMLIRREDLDSVSPEKGRFRSFVLKTLKHFLINDWRRRNRQKRGGGQVPVSIDREHGESCFALAASSESDPERLFEQQWAREILRRTLAQLRESYARAGNARQFSQLSPYLDGMDGGFSYTDLAAGLGVSEASARLAMFRLRQRFRRLLREEIRETVADESEVDDEIEHLFAIFSSRGK